MKTLAHTLMRYFAKFLKTLCMLVILLIAIFFGGIKEYFTGEPTDHFFTLVSTQLKSTPVLEKMDKSTVFCIDGRRFYLLESGAIISDFDAQTTLPMCQGTSFDILRTMSKPFSLGFKCINQQTYLFVRRYHSRSFDTDMFNWYQKCDSI